MLIFATLLVDFKGPKSRGWDTQLFYPFPSIGVLQFYNIFIADISYCVDYDVLMYWEQIKKYFVAMMVNSPVYLELNLCYPTLALMIIARLHKVAIMISFVTGLEPSILITLS